jgi:hypothetical protein
MTSENNSALLSNLDIQSISEVLASTALSDSIYEYIWIEKSY